MMSKELRTKAEAGADPLNLHELFSNMQITTATGQQGRQFNGRFASGNSFGIGGNQVNKNLDKD